MHINKKCAQQLFLIKKQAFDNVKASDSMYVDFMLDFFSYHKLVKLFHHGLLWGTENNEEVKSDFSSES